MPETAQSVQEREASDEMLMARYAAGDGAAFEALFARWERRTYGFFLARTRSPERAEDLYQELFLRIHRARDHYDPARPFAPWLFQIAHRLLVDDHRRAFRSHEVPLLDHESPGARTTAGDLVADREQLGQLLREFSAEERYVVLAAQVEGVGYAELAAELGKSAAAVRKLASRALLRLRSLAGPEPSLRARAG